MDYTEEQLKAISLLRIILGDVDRSIFYPILTDEEYYALLEMHDWNIKKAIRQAGFSILFYLNQTPTRERSGDLERWLNAAIEYRKSLNDLLDDEAANLPTDLRPYAGGISAKEVCGLIHDPDYLRHPLSQITHCSSWWTRVKNYDCLLEDPSWGCGCG